MSTFDKLPKFGSGSPAYASHINENFGFFKDALNNLGDQNSVIKPKSINQSHIEDGSITQSKLNIITNDISTIAGEDLDKVVTKGYLDSQFVFDLTQMFDAPVSVVDPVIQSGAGNEGDPFEYNYYRATSDGLLTVFNDAEVNEPFIVILADDGIDKVKNSKIGKTFPVGDGDGYVDESGVAGQYPTIIRALGIVDGNQPQIITVSAIIRKNDYFKIHSSDNGAATVIATTATWFPFKNGGIEEKYSDDA